MSFVDWGSHITQFTAILGDLSHKTDLYLEFKTFGPVVEFYFTNRHQANWLRKHHPELVPPPEQPGQEPSEHTLGTAFEFYYYSDLAFRLQYLRHIKLIIEHDLVGQEQ